MSSTLIVPFDDATITGVAKAIGELYSGSELTRVLAAAKLVDVDGEGSTKWKRLRNAAAAHQNRHRNGKATIALINEAMLPARTLDRIERARVTRDALNQVLSLSALQVNAEGKVGQGVLARTDEETRARARRLRSLMEARGVHRDVLNGERCGWLRADYYEAVFESIKLLGHRARSMTGLDLDGYELVETALPGSAPRVRLNEYSTVTEKNEQRGLPGSLKGCSATRNPQSHEPQAHEPQAHEPQASWSMSEQDSLDVLATLSLIHRRLDGRMCCLRVADRDKSE